MDKNLAQSWNLRVCFFTRIFSARTVSALASSAFVASLSFGCGAVYPEMETAVREPKAQAVLEPPPPDDLFFIYFEKAAVPPKRQGGIEWEGGAPDPFAKLIVNDHEVLVTPVESKTRAPTWPKQEKQNLRILAGSEVFVEVWDANTMVNHPICHAKVNDLMGIREGGDNEIWCDSGARVWLHVARPKAYFGAGLYYETRGADGVKVTRVARNSPAERAGLGHGDRILAIQGKKVSAMDALQVRSLINQYVRSGLELDVWFKDGKRHLVKLKEGPIYPLMGDDLELTK